MDSVRSDVGEEDEDKRRWYVGRRERAREKAGEGKTVRDLQRMLVVVSGWRR